MVAAGGQAARGYLGDFPCVRLVALRVCPERSLSDSCFHPVPDPAAEADTDPNEPGALRGVLLSGTADYFEEGRSEKVYGLQLSDGSRVPLKFSEQPAIGRGSEVFVWGTRRVDGLHVERFKVARDAREGIGQTGSPLIDPPILMPPLRGALVSVSPTYTKEMLDARILRDDFIKPVLEVSSYGRWTTMWQTFGPLTIPNDCGGTLYDNIGKNGVKAMQDAGIDTTQFDQIQFILGNAVPAAPGAASGSTDIRRSEPTGSAANTIRGATSRTTAKASWCRRSVTTGVSRTSTSARTRIWCPRSRSAAAMWNTEARTRRWRAATTSI